MIRFMPPDGWAAALKRQVPIVDRLSDAGGYFLRMAVLVNVFARRWFRISCETGLQDGVLTFSR